MALFFRFWRKLAIAKEPNNDVYHLLPYHCLDVVAHDYQIANYNIGGLADYLLKLGFTSVALATRWFAYFLACHDIGKYARGFQQLNPHHHSGLVPPINGKIYAVRHDELGYWLWCEKLCQKPDILFFRKTERQLDYYLQQWMTISTGSAGNH